MHSNTMLQDRLDSHSKPRPGRLVKQFKGRTRLNLPLSSKFKTEMCHYLGEQGDCPFKARCTYAHSHSELRTIDRHPKHKTQACRDFTNEGFCPFGERCSFIHYKTNFDKLWKKWLPSAEKHSNRDINIIVKIEHTDNLPPLESMASGKHTMFSLCPPSPSSSGYHGSGESMGSISPGRSRLSSRSSSYSDLTEAIGDPHYLTSQTMVDESRTNRLPIFKDITFRGQLEIWD